MNKVSDCVCHRHKKRVSEMLQDPDARLRRRNRLQLVNEKSPCIPPVNDVCSGVVDGRCLVALLLHYAPQVAKWSGELRQDYWLDTNIVAVFMPFGSSCAFSFGTCQCNYDRHYYNTVYNMSNSENTERYVSSPG